MILKKWEELPDNMRCEEVKKYYDVLVRKKKSLFFKRCFDIIVSIIMIVLLLPLFLLLAIAIKVDSQGPVFYRQERITQYGRTFRIFKFRTMVQNADKLGTHVTVDNDARVTRIGHILRKYRLDEISQLFDVLRGTMTFVGTRPEAVKYVEQYTPEMRATLLLPAGVTSLASILYKDEATLLSEASDVDFTYINDVLPQKMKYNLQEIRDYRFINDIKIMIKTVIEVFK